jgi:xanthine dehydrogenase YagS FAD-binding subunit
MVPFSYSRSAAAPDAVRSASVAAPSHVESPTQFLGGGTTLNDLMKLGVMRPNQLVDIKRVQGNSDIVSSGGALRIGALATMAAVGEHPMVMRDYPVISQSLLLAASQQLRNMARVGGNVLQRTRCNYFRDISEIQCNKRSPGSGCAAINGNNRWHAILGTSSDCIAAYPGDFAQSLAALDAEVEILGKNGQRTVNFNSLHRVPASTPNIETTLVPGELITAFVIKGGPWPQSRYIKIRDRDSYEFGLATAAVALKTTGGNITDVRIALGGVATKPWRASAAEAALKGKRLDQQTAAQAADIAFQGAEPLAYNAYKLPLGKATVIRALLEATAISA